MVSSMLSQQMGLNGMTRMVMDMETILPQHYNLMNAHLILAPLHKTVSDVLIAMVIVGQMQEIGLQTI